MGSRASSGDVVPIFQVDRPTVDYATDSVGRDFPSTRQQLPTKIGRYVVLELLGVGGMGVVCTAYDPKLDRKVALKLLRRKKNETAEKNSTGQARLLREAQALARLNHPNIVTVHDVDNYEGRIYMAMEYVDGLSLDRWLIKAERSWREVVKVFIEAARGLAAAHDAGIIHRDFKPANVLLRKDGRVLVLDFGLAKNEHEEARADPDAAPQAAPASKDRRSWNDALGSTVDTKLTQAGRTVGTPAYMAPEQFLGLPVGASTDQFSLGVALFEALYHHLPFPDDNREELIDRVTEGKVAEPPRDTDVPAWLHRVVLRALEKRREDRFESINELIAALSADPAKRRRRYAMTAGAVAAVGVAAVGVFQGMGGSTDEVCAGAADRVAEVWGQDQKDRVEEAFEATERPFAQDAWLGVERSLDSYSAQWTQVHTAVCRATNVSRDQSVKLMDVRMACLDRRLGEMSALVQVFTDADEKVVSQAVAAAQRLDVVEDCRSAAEDGATEMLADPQRREEAEQIEARLARSKALHTAGRVEAAAEEAKRVKVDAFALGYRPLMARASLQAASAAMARAEDPEQIHDNIVKAIGLASATDQPKLEASGWSMLITLYGDTNAVSGERVRRLEQALVLRLPAELALTKANDPLARAAYEQAVGSVLTNNGRRQDGIAAMLRALRGYQTAEGNHETRVAQVLSNLGGQYAQLGQEVDARHYLEQASRTVEEVYGLHHPLVGPIYINLGAVERRAGNMEAAHTAYLRAHEVLQETMRPDHPHAMAALLGLAQTEVATDLEQAHARFRQLLDVLLGQPKRNLRLVITTYNSLGRLQRDKGTTAAAAGDHAAAEQHWKRAQESFVNALRHSEQLDARRVAPEDLLKVHHNYCLLQLERGLLPEAEAQCRLGWELSRDSKKVDRSGVGAATTLAKILRRQGQEAASVRVLREGVDVAPIELSAPLRLALAEQLWSDPESRSEARAIVRTAQTGLDRGRDGIDDWLREHPEPR